MSEETTTSGAEDQKEGKKESTEETSTEETSTEETSGSGDKDYKQMFKDQQTRAGKAEDEAKGLKETLRKALGEKDKSEEETTKEVDPLDQASDALILIKDLKGNEYVKLRQQASELGISPSKFIGSKAGKAFLKEVRTEEEVAQTTPPPTTKGKTAGSTDSKEVPTDKKFKSFEDWSAEQKSGGSE